MKTKQDNNMINHIGLVYAKIDIELSNLSDEVRSFMKTR